MGSDFRPCFLLCDFTPPRRKPLKSCALLNPRCGGYARLVYSALVSTSALVVVVLRPPICFGLQKLCKKFLLNAPAKSSLHELPYSFSSLNSDTRV